MNGTSLEGLGRRAGWSSNHFDFLNRQARGANEIEAGI